MSELGSWAEAEEFQRSRTAATTPDQRLAWLRRMQEFAYRAGALQRAREHKAETSWKYGKQ